MEKLSSMTLYDVLDRYLRYEGVIGYTSAIENILSAYGIGAR